MRALALLLGSILLSRSGAFVASGQEAAPIQQSPVSETKEYSLGIDWKAGQKFKFSFLMSMSAPSSDKEVTIDTPLTLSVDKVEDGVATISSISGPSMVNGKEVAPKTTVKLRLDRYFEVVEGTSPLTTGGPSYPNHPVRVGQTWTQEIKPTPEKASSGKQTIEFKALRKFGKTEVVVLEAVVTGQSKDEEGIVDVKGKSTTHINLADGMIDQFTSVVHSYIKSAKVATIKFALTRLPE